MTTIDAMLRDSLAKYLLTTTVRYKEAGVRAVTEPRSLDSLHPADGIVTNGPVFP
jgi:hypothetical protein